MVPLVKTYLPSKDILLPELEKVLYSGYVSQGKQVELFEEKLSNYIENKFCVTLNSGTAALHIALILAGVKAGDEVISTPITAEPTNVAITMIGAKIVWADVDPRNGNICPKDVEKKITKRTKAIVVVDYAGNPVDVDAFKKIEASYKIPVIQDSAHAFGAKFRNKKLGNHFRFTTFSFQAIKHMTTVDGGLIVLSNEEDYDKAKLIRWFGLDKSKSRMDNDVSIQGYKYHMNDVNATIGLVQMENIGWLIDSYINNGKFYDEELDSVNGIEKIHYYDGAEPSYWLYTVLVERKDCFVKKMEENGIIVGQLHKRNDINSLFSDSKDNDLVNVEHFEKRWVHLPCGWWVSEKERTHIINVIKSGW